jgi:hypothetical protein
LIGAYCDIRQDPFSAHQLQTILLVGPENGGALQPEIEVEPVFHSLFFFGTGA